MKHWTDQLSEYLDGTLSAADRREAEAHLAVCLECARTLEDLRLVVARAQALEPREPGIDLWPEIAARLEPRRAGIRERIADWIGSRRISLTLPQLAAATAAVAMVAVGLSWLGFRGPAGPVATRSPAARVEAPAPAGDGVPESVDPITRETPSRRRATDDAGQPVQGTFAAFDQAGYESAVADLERVLRDHRADLDTSTVRILEQNLAIIDRAVLEARRALEADPANPYLNNHLASQMMRKIRLLQTAAGVVAAHS